MQSSTRDIGEPVIETVSVANVVAVWEKWTRQRTRRTTMPSPYDRRDGAAHPRVCGDGLCNIEIARY